MAKHVDILETTPDGQRAILTVTVEGGRLVAVGQPPEPAARLLAELPDLVRRIPRFKDVTPADGGRFLAALRFALTGSYIRAGRPYEAPDG